MNYLVGIIGLLIGVVTFISLKKIKSSRKQTEAKQAAQLLKNQAELRAQNILERTQNDIERRKELLASQLEHDQVFLSSTTEHLDERNNSLEHEAKAFSEKQGVLNEKKEHFSELSKQYQSIISNQLESLERMAKLDTNSGLAMIMEDTMECELENQTKRWEKKLYHYEGKIEDHAKAIMNVINQRYSGESTRDPTLIEIEFSDAEFLRIVGDEQMSKIIHLQTSLGAELKMELCEKRVRIFGYDLWRRYIIKGALERMKKNPKLLLDTAIIDTQKYTEDRMMKIGMKACKYLGITDFPPELVKLVGRLDYRTSFGQNIYRHSIEVAILGRMIAEEIGCDPYICIVGGLLHDIGKGVDADIAGAHDTIGRDLALNFHLHPDIVHSIYAHHEAEPYRSVEARVVQLADAISAARPGARHHESLEDYVGRMKALEEAALSQKGVEKAFVIQAGREVRAFVDASTTDDTQTQSIAKEIATAVQASNAVRSGEVKIQVIREYTTHAVANRSHLGHKPKR